MVNESELRAQMIDAFDNVEYPLANPMELLPTLPNGAETRFESDAFSMSVIELNMELDSDFPYQSVEELVDHIFEELRANDKI